MEVHLSEYGRLGHFKDGTSARGWHLKLQGTFHVWAYNGVPTIAKADKARYLVTLHMPVRPDELDHRYPVERKDTELNPVPHSPSQAGRTTC